MSEPNLSKPEESHIASTEDISKLLKLDGQEKEPLPSQPAENVTPTLPLGQLPPDLPFMETLEEPPRDLEAALQAAPQEPPSSAGPVAQILGPASDKGNEAYAFVLWLTKSVAPYLLIFLIGLGLYFFYFSDFSFTNFFRSSSITLEKVTEKSGNKDLEKLKSEQKDSYLKWMAQFFFAVNDEAIVSMDTDVSGNGLTNFEKYLLDLNPKVYSTRGNNRPDGELVTEGINPWTGKPFSDKQKELVDKYINKELISNRITAAALTRGVTKFAQYVNTDSPYYIDPVTFTEMQKQNQVISPPGVSSTPEIASNQAAYAAAQHVSSNGTITTAPANFSSGTDINTAVPGKLEVPANNISVPLTWTKDVKDFDEDLKKGVVHYPGTAMPGQLGTSYISGHSSGYIWDHSPYKTVFAVLGQVDDGTSFVITATQKDGRQVKYHYVVTGRGEFAANDQAQFVNTADSVVALSTCWPVGTTARRLVVFGKLTQTEN
jgi:sortase A